MVFTVSTGVKNILKQLAIIEADKVFTEMLKFYVFLLWFKYSNVNLFEKVSPNQEIGPYNKATE